jgi:carboxyl-terminal processing protease
MNILNKTFIISVIAIFMLAGHSSGQESHNFQISKSLDIYSALLKELDMSYADEINPEDLTEEAIEAMLETLDPYTVFIPESRAEDFKMMTTGQYGGIGALIHQQDNYVVISAPYLGFPAQKSGLKAGDRIIQINGESAKGKSSSDVSDILKGQPGVTLKILVKPYGQEEQVLKEVVREKITIPNVPYYGMVEDHYAYIKLTNFTKNAGAEVKKAFLDLKNNHEVEGVIIDLRGNGGGLLYEAVNLTNLFVEKGQLVVTTKGKLSSKNHEHHTRSSALDTKIPVAVLVDKGSASASEIVAGAIQDLDRGIIIGQKTYGKGLVQNVVPLAYNTQAKITVAKYYIPSGRCIQAIDYFHKDENGNSGKIPDSLKSEFSTRNGRIVYDGGGIEPDVNTDARRLSKISQVLVYNYHIFDYACHFVNMHEQITPPEEFVVTDEIYNDFIAFLDDRDYEYHTKSEDALEELKKKAMKEDYFEAIEEDYNALKEKLIHDKKEDLRKHEAEIGEILQDEIVGRYYYLHGRIINSLATDEDIATAVQLFQSNDTYASILDGTFVEQEEEGPK